jgi:hypothetical protein
MVFNAHRFDTETKQVLWICTLLRGTAFNWISPFLVDFMQHKSENSKCTQEMKKETIQYFHTMVGFGKGINRVFGDLEEEKTAERRLQGLRQKGPATSYTAEFQQCATRTGWNEEALKAQYYRGLKDSVKDEMARSGKPEDLNAMIDLAVRIDNRLFERSLEKKGHYPTSHGMNRKSGRNFSSHSPMELDATAHQRKPPSKEVMDKRRRDKLCFECGLPGHMASSHNKGPRKPWAGKRKQVNATGRKGYNESKSVCATHNDQRGEPLPDGEGPYETLSQSDSELYQASPGSMWIHGQRRTIRFAPEIPSEDEDDEDQGGVAMERQRIAARFTRRELRGQAIYDEELTDSEGGPAYQEGTSSEEEVADPESEESSSEEEEPGSDSEDGGLAEETPNPENSDEWPMDYPQLNSHWQVHQREQGLNGANGSRQWQHLRTKRIFTEPGRIPDGYGPDWGEVYRVKYQDHRRIGWKQVAGPKCYMQHLPWADEEFTGCEPQTGENWELAAQGTTTRLWMHTTKRDTYHKEIYHSGVWKELAPGQVYTLAYQGRNHRWWVNVLTDERYREVCATSGNGHFNTRVRVGNFTLIALIDSGASANFISAKTVSRLKLRTEMKEEPYHLSTVNGESIDEAEGLICVETEEFQLMHCKTRHFECIRMDLAPIGKHEIILGGPWLATHNPVIDWTEQQIEFTRCECPKRKAAEKTVSFDKQLCATSKQEHFHDEGSTVSEIAPEKYYKEFMDLFKEELTELALPKHQSWDHKIELTPGSEPVPGPVYSLSADDLGTLRTNLDKDLAKGFIRESKSSARYPVLFVPKKDGPRRMCIDYRKLNEMTIKDAYALPLADELRQRLAGAKIFTQLDLRGAYNLVRIAPGHEWKTAFGCRYGHFEYTVMPFGLCNAPATMQRLINNVLRSYLDIFCIGYLDDILVYSQNEEEHIQHVRKVLSALKEHHLLLKPEKCHFHTKKLTFLGYVVTPEGLSMDPEKVRTVLDWEPPTTVTEVQSFLGFANYYRRFIKGYSDIAQPLTELTKKDREFNWDSKCQDAFWRLKDKFIGAPLLVSFDPEKQIRLETDASDLALGAVVSQPNADNK